MDPSHLEAADWYDHEPDPWAASLVTYSELLLAVFEAAGVRSVAEIGAYAGELTQVLADWARNADARVVAIDPTPEPALVELVKQRPEVELDRRTSHDALPDIPLPDAVIIDGDHNYYTVSEELRLIDERAGASGLPLLIFHDVGWPHARRDTYHAPDRIPEEARQPLERKAGVFPGKPGLVKGGMTFEYAARREGGPRNGVLTAVEDFIEGRDSLQLATIPIFFGCGILWERDAAWASAVAELVEPWDANPVLARLEANRVYHLATITLLLCGPFRGEQLLENLLDSRVFALADRVSWLRQGGKGVSWQDQIREVLEQEPQITPP